jgi:hypothetical protein
MEVVYGAMRVDMVGISDRLVGRREEGEGEKDEAYMRFTTGVATE